MSGIDSLGSILSEQQEAVGIIQEAFPEMTGTALAENAKTLRSDRYARGRYLTLDEIRSQWPPRPRWL